MIGKHSTDEALIMSRFKRCLNLFAHKLELTQLINSEAKIEAAYKNAQVNLATQNQPMIDFLFNLENQIHMPPALNILDIIQTPLSQNDVSRNQVLNLRRILVEQPHAQLTEREIENVIHHLGGQVVHNSGGNTRSVIFQRQKTGSFEVLHDKIEQGTLTSGWVMRVAKAIKKAYALGLIQLDRLPYFPPLSEWWLRIDIREDRSSVSSSSSSSSTASSSSAKKDRSRSSQKNPKKRK